MEKLVSIIVPMYNASSRIEVCLESILNQTYRNIEVVVVDDGSKDNSYTLVSRLAQKDKRIKLISQENGGVSKARNTALDNATGEYIEFVDSDDTLEKDMVETMVKLLEDNDCDLAECNNSHPFFRTFLHDEVYDFSKKEDFLAFYQEIFAPLFPWNKMWRRKCLEGLKFDENIHFSEDELFNSGTYKSVRRAVTTSRTLYNYYIDPLGSGVIMNMVRAGVLDSEKTFFFMGLLCLPTRLEYFKQAVEQKSLDFTDPTDLAYIRVFDYVMLEWFAYAAAHVNEEMLGKELEHIYFTKEFQTSLELHKKFGFDFYGLDEEETRERLVLANKLMVRSCIKTLSYQLPAIPTQVVIASFIYVMSKKRSAPIKSRNITNMLYEQLVNNSTPLAHLVNDTARELGLEPLRAEENK
ncbi:MAG: glycosyltransferase [Acholeplasmatales bacterium]|nr:glycosyltransferase [Acholeplasmatales bacterium]